MPVKLLEHSFVKKKTLSPLKSKRGQFFFYVESSLPKDALIVPSLVEIGSVVLEKILKFLQTFSLFRYYYYLPLEKGVAFHLNKLEFLSP